MIEIHTDAYKQVQFLLDYRMNGTELGILKISRMKDEKTTCISLLSVNTLHQLID